MGYERGRLAVVAGVESGESFTRFCGHVDENGRDGRTGNPALVWRNESSLDVDACAGAAQALKLQLFDAIQSLEAGGATTIAVPCFASHVFIDELQENVSIRIANMLEALRNEMAAQHGGSRRIGVLAPAYVRRHKLFERYFEAPKFELLYPHSQERGGGAPEAGTIAGGGCGIEGNAFRCERQTLAKMCASLVEHGADVIVPGSISIFDVLSDLAPLAVPLIDPGLVYARYAVSVCADSAADVPVRPFKVGIVGGVGPAATVDFMHKIVANTPARRDQDHIKLLVEQNPQIPDRTESLVGNGTDPTISLYATCKRLEAGGANAIAIPCNTAHAFVDRIQPRLKVPIINMMTATVNALRSEFPGVCSVGLLATTGTIASGLYQKALEARGLSQIVPGSSMQARVMNAIYGTTGVKAGYTSGPCKDDILAAVDQLVELGAEVIVLGCTELPLLLPGQQVRSSTDVTVPLLDPTEVLAKRCIAYARPARGNAAAAWSEEPGVS